MADSQIKIVSAAEARRVLTEGGIREEVGFQNDINTLLARLEEKVVPLKALTPPIKAITRKTRKKAGRA